jgi:hypothetical protein
VSVVEKHMKLIWQACQQVRVQINLHFHNFVTLLHGKSFGLIPWKRATEKVEENVSNEFKSTIVQYCGGY